jgi:hypothetical protein
MCSTIQAKAPGVPKLLSGISTYIVFLVQSTSSGVRHVCSVLLEKLNGDVMILIGVVSAAIAFLKTGLRKNVVGIRLGAKVLVPDHVLISSNVISAFLKSFVAPVAIYKIGPSSEAFVNFVITTDFIPHSSKHIKCDQVDRIATLWR